MRVNYHKVHILFNKSWFFLEIEDKYKQFIEIKWLQDRETRHSSKQSQKDNFDIFCKVLLILLIDN